MYVGGNYAKKETMNFDDLEAHSVKMLHILSVIGVSSAGMLIAEYANPIIGTISLLGSAVYIWLKVKKEFYTKDKKQ